MKMHTLRKTLGRRIGIFAILGAGALPGQTAVDPGVRTGTPVPGGTVAGLTSNQKAAFTAATSVFKEVNNTVGSPVGLGPGFNSDSCVSCHAQPATGGSSPATNPLFNVYQLNGATNTMPSFITTNSPVVNARSPFLADGITPDGKVQQLFVITGRTYAPPGCNATQPNFAAELAANNLIFRQTTPVYGDGLLEIIQNADILASFNSTASARALRGIGGHASIAPDGSISRFGWKAQHRSLILFSGDAYNTEEGITNELSLNEINTTPGCDTNPMPEDHTLYSATFPAHAFDGDPQDLANFMRFLGAPPRGTATASTKNGQTQFNKVGCNLCHTQSFKTPVADVAALSNITVNLFSDLMVHHMGPCLADNIVQGNVQGDEFRTAPLWGVSQRVFFMHDGRTTNIVQAIEDHFCNANAQYQASEADTVINTFNALSPTNQQDLVNFLRIL
jgi:CxxC motif-containing protein (DUF1111 family)